MSLNPNEINITTIAGPPYVGIILNWGLFGVLSIQVYLYSQAFPNDRPWLKVLVGAVYLLEMVQTFLLTETGWKWLVSGYGNLEAMDQVGTTWLSAGILGGLMGFIVQWFYAYRIAIISRNRIIPGIIILMSLITFGGAIATSVKVKQGGLFTKVLSDESQNFIEFGLWGGTSSVCDVIIAVSMCYYLHRGRCNSYGTFPQTEALVSKLIRMTIETGAITATISILEVVLYYPPRFQNLTYYEIPVSVHAKLYSTTMLAVLNSRMKLALISESATWRDNEMSFARPHSSRDTNRVELNISSTDGSLHNSDFPATKEEVSANIGDPKIPNIVPPMH